MKQTLLLLLTTIGFNVAPASRPPKNSFSTCSAAFIDGKMIVDQYTTQGRCQLPATATGDLTVQTVALSASCARAIAPIEFSVAIRNKATGTLHRYSTETYRRLPVRPLLSRCQKGDAIVLLTVRDQYALPHNEIIVK